MLGSDSSSSRSEASTQPTSPSRANSIATNMLWNDQTNLFYLRVTELTDAFVGVREAGATNLPELATRGVLKHPAGRPDHRSYLITLRSICAVVPLPVAATNERLRPTTRPTMRSTKGLDLTRPIHTPHHTQSFRHNRVVTHSPPLPPWQCFLSPPTIVSPSLVYHHATLSLSLSLLYQPGRGPFLWASIFLFSKQRRKWRKNGAILSQYFTTSTPSTTISTTATAGATGISQTHGTIYVAHQRVSVQTAVLIAPLHGSRALYSN